MPRAPSLSLSLLGSCLSGSLTHTWDSGKPSCPLGLRVMGALGACRGSRSWYLQARCLSLSPGWDEQTRGRRQGGGRVCSFQRIFATAGSRVSQLLLIAPAGPLGYTLHLSPGTLAARAQWEGPCHWKVPGTLSHALCPDVQAGLHSEAWKEKDTPFLSIFYNVTVTEGLG